MIVEPIFFKLIGKLKVWWDTSSGLLQASFLRKPMIELTLPLALRSCACCSISGRLQAIGENALSKLDLNHPFTVPFKAPAALRFANIPMSDVSRRERPRTSS